MLCTLDTDNEAVEPSATALGALCWQNEHNIKAVLECGGIEELVLSLRKGQDPCISTVTATRILSLIVSFTRPCHVLSIKDEALDAAHFPSAEPDFLENNLKNGDWTVSRSSSTYAPSSSASSMVTQSCPVTPTSKSHSMFTPDADSTPRIRAIRDEHSPQKPSIHANLSTSSHRLSKILDRNRVHATSSEILARGWVARCSLGETGINTAEVLSKIIGPELTGDEHFGMKLLVSLVLYELSLSNEEVCFELADILKYGLQPLASQFIEERQQQNTNLCAGFWEACANKIPTYWFRY